MMDETKQQLQKELTRIVALKMLQNSESNIDKVCDEAIKKLLDNVDEVLKDKKKQLKKRYSLK